MSVTLEQLKALDAVEREGSFSNAARALHRVPSALTYLIQGLEEQLEVKLFERRGRRSVLTEAGHKILRHARDVLLQVDDLNRAALSFEMAGKPNFLWWSTGRCLRPD